MPFKIIDKYYLKVYELWKKGRNPTLKCNLLPLKKGLPSFYYTNFNTVIQDLLVNGLFEITWGYDGSVEDGNIGLLRTTNITSEGYTSEIFFKGCAIELNRQVLEFYNKYGTNYEFIIEIYADAEIKQQQSTTSTDQVKVLGDATTTPPPVTSIGATFTTTDDYTVYTYNSIGSITFTDFLDTTINVLAVGAGGDVQSPDGGQLGGGGGGEVYEISYTITGTGTIDIIVGTMVSGSNGLSTTLKNRTNTLTGFTNITANGGGVGTNYGTGGNSGNVFSGSVNVFSGGVVGGGGGGAGQNGSNGTYADCFGVGYFPNCGGCVNSTATSGNGGDGIQPTLSGLPTTTYYGAGGGRIGPNSYESSSQQQPTTTWCQCNGSGSIPASTGSNGQGSGYPGAGGFSSPGSAFNGIVIIAIPTVNT